MAQGHLRAGVLAVMLAAVSAVPAFGQQPITLQQAVATALEKNPVRKAAVFEEQAAHADAKEARAPLLPQISFREIYQRGNDPVYAFGSKLRQQRFSAADFGLNVLNTPTPLENYVTRFAGGWQLFDSGVSWLRAGQAKKAERLAQQKLERTDQELVMRVVEAYAGLLLAVKQQQVAEDGVKTAQAVVDRSQANVQAGMVVESDLLSAQVNLAARQQELIRARNAVALAQAQLAHEMGVPVEGAYQPADLALDKALPTPALDELEKSALERRPDLQGITLQQGMQSANVRMAKASFGPRLNAVADWEMDNPRFGGGGGNNWMMGVELQLDLFDGGAKVARLEHERAMKSRVDALRAAAASGIQLEVRKAYLDLDAARQQVEVARAAVGQAKESLRIGEDRYESGLNTITDLLRMQEASLRAQTDYWAAVYRLQTGYANLELATGTLDANSRVVMP